MLSLYVHACFCVCGHDVGMSKHVRERLESGLFMSHQFECRETVVCISFCKLSCWVCMCMPVFVFVDMTWLSRDVKARSWEVRTVGLRRRWLGPLETNWTCRLYKEWHNHKYIVYITFTLCIYNINWIKLTFQSGHTRWLHANLFDKSIILCIFRHVRRCRSHIMHNLMFFSNFNDSI